MIYLEKGKCGHLNKSGTTYMVVTRFTLFYLCHLCDIYVVSGIYTTTDTKSLSLLQKFEFIQDERY